MSVESTLLNLDYSRCAITQEGTDTLYVHNVKGTELKLCFKRCIRHWKVIIEVSGELVSVAFNLAVMDVNNDVMEFWDKLYEQAAKQDGRKRDVFYKGALRILGYLE